MTQQTQQDNTSLTVERTVDAPIDRVWKAFTDANELNKWYAPGPMRAEVHKLDLRPDGAFEVSMTGAMEPGAEESTHTMKGAFRTIEPNKLLVHSWKWESDDPAMQGESVVTVTLTDVGGKTKVTLKHTGLPNEESVQSHSQGWVGCLENLATKGL